MANRRAPQSPPPIEVKSFTPDEIDRGIARLRRRIEEVGGLRSSGIRYDNAKVKTAEANIRESVRETFGPNSPEFRDHEHHDIWHGGYNLYDEEHDCQRKFLEGISQTTIMLEGLIARLEEKRADLVTANLPAAPTVIANFDGKSVFVVHGHDEEAKQATARFLEKLKLQPVILGERPDEGRTVIEKFERDSDVSFAVVIMTPDDIGYPTGHEDMARPRARQNVVLELGYFIGKLKRSRVAVLYKGSVEIPSDYHGVVYIQMDEADGWKLRLARELKQAKMQVDLNDAV